MRYCTVSIELVQFLSEDIHHYVNPNKCISVKQLGINPSLY